MNATSYRYKTIAFNTSAEYKDRGSKFIAYCFPVATIEDVKKYIKETKLLHPKAVHHCYAYKIGFENTNYRTVDDGEPSGSAGKPIFSQIESFELTNCIIIVVRYWGGVLLGVPGLIAAYKTAAKDAIRNNSIIEKNIERKCLVQFDYTIQNEVMRIVKSYDCTVESQELSLFYTIYIGIANKNYQEVLGKLKKLVGVEIKEL